MEWGKPCVVGSELAKIHARAWPRLRALGGNEHRIFAAQAAAASGGSLLCAGRLSRVRSRCVACPRCYACTQGLAHWHARGAGVYFRIILKAVTRKIIFTAPFSPSRNTAVLRKLRNSLRFRATYVEGNVRLWDDDSTIILAHNGCQWGCRAWLYCP